MTLDNGIRQEARQEGLQEGRWKTALTHCKVPKPLSLLDRLLVELNHGLQAVAGVAASSRDYPASLIPESVMNMQQRKHSARLMRVNHCGEVCAQALYRAQACVARDQEVSQLLLRLAAEETDHLAWCRRRLDELSGRPSYLNFLWYGGSFAIGLFAGWIGDKWSLGFMEETELQVSRHLQGHLDHIQSSDAKSAAVIRQMQSDEAQHARTAAHAHSGTGVLPRAVTYAMALQAQCMTTLAFWL